MFINLYIYLLLIVGILIINSQNYIHSTIQKFTWGVHASTVNNVYDKCCQVY